MVTSKAITLLHSAPTPVHPTLPPYGVLWRGRLDLETRAMRLAGHRLLSAWLSPPLLLLAARAPMSLAEPPRYVVCVVFVRCLDWFVNELGTTQTCGYGALENILAALA